MAKKKSVVVKKQTEIVKLDQFTVGGNLDVNDVLSVVTTRAEQKYSASLQQCIDRAAQIDKELEVLEKKIDKSYRDALYGGKNAQKIAALEAAIVALCPDKKITTSNHIYLKDGVLSGNISTRHNCLSMTITAPVSKEVENLHKQRDDLQKQKSDANRDAIGWRRKLNNVPMLERQYRAQIAERKLAENAEGQQLLEMLTANLDSDIASLPAL